MKPFDIAASLVVHAAVIGVAVHWLSLPSSKPHPESEPFYFEIVEEAAAEEVARDEVRREAVRDETVRDETVRDVQPEAPAEPQAAEPPLPEPCVADASPPRSAEPPPPSAPMPRALDSIAAPPAEEERAQVLTAAPHALGRIVPVYPRSARRKGHEGDVTLELLVAADGVVSDAAVAASSGHDELDQAALQAARTARFAPATADGTAVEGRIRLTFDFKLR